MRAAAAWGAVVALSACSSDDLPEPEATITTRGAFVAVDYGEGPLTLYRILDYADLNLARLLFISSYRVEPQTYDEARELAKDHDLPVRIEFDYLPIGSVESNPHQVVWFRTLTEEEEERVP
jgi:hypothetical protein